MKENSNFDKYAGKPAPLPPNPADYDNPEALEIARYQHKKERMVWKYWNSPAQAVIAESKATRAERRKKKQAEIKFKEWMKLNGEI